MPFRIDPKIIHKFDAILKSQIIKLAVTVTNFKLPN